MAKVLSPRNFQLFRSVVAEWEPSLCQPITYLWDVQMPLMYKALLQMRKRLHYRTSASLFNRDSTAYALSVLIQQERLQSYITHKASWTIDFDETCDCPRRGRLTLTVPNVNNLALDFARHSFAKLDDKCFGWVNSQLQRQFPDAVEPTRSMVDDVRRISESLHRIVFPHYIRYALQQPVGRSIHPAEHFLETYEKASFRAADDGLRSTSPERIHAIEKFYLVNMANPDKQGDKFRFREICDVVDQVLEWERIANRIRSC